MSSLLSRHAHALAFTAALLCSAPTLLFASQPTGALTVEPTVPRPTSQPCVVTVFAADELISHDSRTFALPPECPGPWSKIVLEADLTSLVRTNSVADLRVELIDNTSGSEWTLYMGGPQIHAGVPSWRVERDLTDYTNLFRSSGREWYVGVDHDWDNSSPSFDTDSVRGNVRVLFYPPGGAERAPRVPDAVFAQDTLQTFPQNIVKAYVEVLAQGQDSFTISGNSDRFWFLCLPTATMTAYPALRNRFAPGDEWGASLSSSTLGCNGGSFREAEVWLDGTIFMGIAPVYPWLPSNIYRSFHDTIDTPVPSAQALNFIPYRVDVTPFAFKLNDGAPHRLSVRIAGDTGVMNGYAEGQLFVYTDPRRSIVRGGLMVNTLTHAAPSVVTSFPTPAPGTDPLTGTVATSVSRKMDLVGFLNTSAGLVYSAVHTEVDFTNQQSVRVSGFFPAEYGAYIELAALDSRVAQGSVRVLGGTVLESDASRVQYPLRLAYGLAGRIIDTGEGYFAIPVRATVVADQIRSQVSDQWRGATRYSTGLRDHFAGRHSRWFLYNPGEMDIDWDWDSQRDYVFIDSRGGCYTAARVTVAGALTGSSTGAGCPGSVNNNGWFTRPDGSTDNMGWAP